MADEQARPLTPDEIGAIRATLAAGIDPRYPADAFAWWAAANLLATLDAWRPVMERLAGNFADEGDDGRFTCIHCEEQSYDGRPVSFPHDPHCPVTLARRLLGQPS